MSKESSFEKLKQLLLDQLDNKNVKVLPESSAADFEEWDSIFHIGFMVSVEDAFGVKFTASEMTEFKTLGELADLIERKK